MDEREPQTRRPVAPADALASVEEPALAEALGSADAPRTDAGRPSPPPSAGDEGGQGGEIPAYAGMTGSGVVG